MYQVRIGGGLPPWDLQWATNCSPTRHWVRPTHTVGGCGGTSARRHYKKKWMTCLHHESMNDLYALWVNEWLVCIMSQWMTCMHYESMNDLYALWVNEWLVCIMSQWMICMHYESMNDLHALWVNEWLACIVSQWVKIKTGIHTMFVSHNS